MCGSQDDPKRRGQSASCDFDRVTCHAGYSGVQLLVALVPKCRLASGTGETTVRSQNKVGRGWPRVMVAALTGPWVTAVTCPSHLVYPFHLFTAHTQIVYMSWCITIIIRRSC